MIKPRAVVADMIRSNSDEPSRLYQYRLDRCERTIPFHDKFMALFRERLDSETLMTYPEVGPLYEKFSKWLSVERNQLLFHTGSDLAIKAIFEAYIDPGARILLHRPGYAMYGVYASMFQAETDIVSYDRDLNFAHDYFIKMISDRYRMVVVENPNGFIGDPKPLSWLKEVVSKASHYGVIAVIDEAYYHFHKETVAPWIDDFDNLIVVRTASKALGLAGVRCGYLLSQPDNIAMLRKVKPMHELTSPAIVALLTLLDCLDDLEEYLTVTRKGLCHLIQELNGMGVRTSNACANFLVADIGRFTDPVTLADTLYKQGVLIRRPLREPHLASWSRIGIGSIESSQIILDSVRSILNGVERT